MRKAGLLLCFLWNVYEDHKKASLVQPFSLIFLWNRNLFLYNVVIDRHNLRKKLLDAQGPGLRSKAATAYTLASYLLPSPTAYFQRSCWMSQIYSQSNGGLTSIHKPWRKSKKRTKPKIRGPHHTKGFSKTNKNITNPQKLQPWSREQQMWLEGCRSVIVVKHFGFLHCFFCSKVLIWSGPQLLGVFGFCWFSEGFAICT